MEPNATEPNATQSNALRRHSRTPPTCTGRFRIAVLAASLAAVTLLPLPTALGGDGSAEDRFHDAYATEVVDGRIADAARTYLKLSNDADAPARIRAEARFRFAVCSVLLGRPDEARTLLADLVADETVPAVLRDRAREYRTSIDDVGMGTELDQKLQDLMFELGRTDIASHTPAIYRDFQILGTAAQPFLTKLMGHSDLAIRQHAFRLLCRMNEPAMMERWAPEITRSHPWVTRDARGYIERNPEQLAVLKERLRALTDQDLGAVFGGDFLYLEWDADFLDEVAQRDIGVSARIRTAYALGEEAGWDRLALYAESEDRELAVEAVLALLGKAAGAAPSGRPRAGRLPQWTSLALESDRARLVENLRRRRSKDPVVDGLRNLALRAPVDDAVAALTIVIEASRERATAKTPVPVELGYWTPFCDALGRRIADPGLDRARYARLLLDLGEVLRDRAADTASGRDWAPAAEYRSHLSLALAQLRPADLTMVGREMLSRFASETGDEFAMRLPYMADGRAEAVLDVLESVGPARRERVLAAMTSRATGVRKEGQYAPGFAELLTLAIERSGWSSGGRMDELQGQWVIALAALPAETAAERFAGMLASAASLPTDQRGEVFRRVVGAPVHASTLRVHTGLIAPALPAMYELVPPNEDRKFLARYAHAIIGTAEKQTLDLGPARDVFAAFVRNHYAPHSQPWHDIARRPDLFPIAGWIPYVHPSAWGRQPGWVRMELERHSTPEQIDAAADELTRDPAAVTRNVIGFVRQVPSEEARTRILDRLLREAPPATLRIVFAELDTDQLVRAGRKAMPGSPDAQDVALQRLSTAEPTDVWALEWIARVIQRDRPSEALYPAARRLLRSEEKRPVLAGVAFAGKLGRTEMIPDLVAKLDSMDDDIRTSARSAIDSILELERLRKEAREAYGDDGK